VVDKRLLFGVYGCDGRNVPVDDDILKEEVREIIQEFLGEGNTISFSEDWNALPEEDWEDFVKDLRKMKRRMDGPLGFFWRWWYRPKPVV
jgi:hypothetical protein